MKALSATTLIFLGGVWLCYATIVPSVMRMRAMSDAMQIEGNLKAWASGKVSEGKLGPGDILEIFPENDSLRFGGENPNKNFHEMVAQIAQSCAPPILPGVILIAVGLIAACRSSWSTKAKQEAEQGVTCID